MTIVVGWVPKPEGRAALDRAIEEARLRDERLVVVNASSGGAYADASYATEAQLAEVRATLAASGVRYDVRQHLRGKQPSQEVVEAAEEAAASLVVIGLRHRTAVGKFLLGSSAQEILMGVACPVLCVPPEGDRAAAW